MVQQKTITETQRGLLLTGTRESIQHALGGHAERSKQGAGRERTIGPGHMPLLGSMIQCFGILG